MKRNTILKALAVTIVTASAVQLQAQGIYIKKKSGETDIYPARVLDKVTPVKTTTTTESTGGEVKKGVVTTLRYEQLPDMKTARISHQIFPSGDGFVVVGGHTKNFQLTKTAEIYQNGSWKDISIANNHDGAFSVQLPDGRFMVGGGFSSSWGVGQSTGTDIYDPKTQTFSQGPQLTSARSQSKAINADGTVYVSGNWYVSDMTMDLFNGSSFKAVGEMDGHTNPYMMTDNNGYVYVFSTMDTMGNTAGFYTFDDGTEMLLADRYQTTTGETDYYILPFTPESMPVALPDDARPEDYHIVHGGKNYYMVLTKTNDGYQLLMVNIDETEFAYRFLAFDTFEIPTKDIDGNAITWRGGVKVNSAREELYIIGASGPSNKQTLHIISFSYQTMGWTMASAKGFKHNMLSASWTLLADGRLACTGGGINNNFDAQNSAYVFTLPTAGTAGPTETDVWGVDVHMKDGSTKYYSEKDVESITSYE